MTEVELTNRIEEALEIAISGAYDGAHHKMWVIDQIVRALTGCDRNLKGVLQPNNEYKAWVMAFEDGHNGPKTYEWDVGIAP